MHKLCIFLAYDEDRLDLGRADDVVAEYLDDSYEEEWDWYEIGGRWSGELLIDNMHIDTLDEVPGDMEDEDGNIQDKYKANHGYGLPDVRPLSDLVTYYNVVRIWNDDKATLKKKKMQYSGQFRTSFDDTIIRVINSDESPEYVLRNPKNWYAIVVDVHN